MTAVYPWDRPVCAASRMQVASSAEPIIPSPVLPSMEAEESASFKETIINHEQ